VCVRVNQGDINCTWRFVILHGDPDAGISRPFFSQVFFFQTISPNIPWNFFLEQFPQTSPGSFYPWTFPHTSRNISPWTIHQNISGTFSPSTIPPHISRNILRLNNCPAHSSDNYPGQFPGHCLRTFPGVNSSNIFLSGNSLLDISPFTMRPCQPSVTAREQSFSHFKSSPLSFLWNADCTRVSWVFAVWWCICSIYVVSTANDGSPDAVCLPGAVCNDRQSLCVRGVCRCQLNYYASAGRCRKTRHFNCCAVDILYKILARSKF